MCRHMHTGIGKRTSSNIDLSVRKENHFNNFVLLAISKYITPVW